MAREPPLEIQCATLLLVPTICPHSVTLLAAYSFCNIAFDYSCMERYQLQPTKSVVIPVKGRRKSADRETEWKLGEDNMPVVDKTTHVGVLRTNTNKSTGHVENNISKAQRTMYGLMAAGLHGEIGLDPETALQLFRVYVMPILTYGLEIYLPTGTDLKWLDAWVGQNFS